MSQNPETKPKLELHRQTLRNLTAGALERVVGGNVTTTTGWWCPSTDQSAGGPDACHSGKSVSYCNMQCC